MINIFGVEHIVKLPTGDEYVDEVTLASYIDPITKKLVMDYKTVGGTSIKFKLTREQWVQLSKAVYDG